MPKDGSNASRPTPLPAGRHGLSRRFVKRNQRERILDATIDATAELGYHAMNVEDIVSRAGVSRRTFYEQFANKHDAFHAAFDDAAGQLFHAVQKAFERETTFESRLIEGLRTLLNRLAAVPNGAIVCIVEANSAGPEAVARRTGVMAAFAAVIEEHARDLPGAGRLPSLTAETIVGGIYETVFRRIADGRVAELPGLLPDLIEAALLPYVGAPAAAANARHVRAGGSGGVEPELGAAPAAADAAS
jgi:AcrR family transcriptional regulator